MMFVPTLQNDSMCCMRYYYIHELFINTTEQPKFETAVDVILAAMPSYEKYVLEGKLPTESKVAPSVLSAPAERSGNTS